LAFWQIDGIFFTIINLEPKYVEDIIFTALILHNMLLNSPNSRNVYHPPSFVDTVLEHGEILEGGWCENLESLDSLQVPHTGHNASLCAKSVRETFLDYFINDGAVEMAVEILLIFTFYILY